MGRHCNSLFILCGLLSHTRLFNHISAWLETNDSTGRDMEHPLKRSTGAVAFPIMSIQTQPRQWNQNVRKGTITSCDSIMNGKHEAKREKTCCSETAGGGRRLICCESRPQLTIKQADTNCDAVMKSDKRAGKSWSEETDSVNKHQI